MYEVLLRGITLLGILQIVFDYLGADRLNTAAVKIGNFSQRIRAFNLPSRFAAMVRTYAKWLFHTANRVIKQTDLIGSSFERWLKARQRRKEPKIYSYLNTEDDSDEVDFGWKVNLILIAVTSGLVYLEARSLFYFFPHLAARWQERMTTPTKGMHWYAKLPFIVFVQLPLQGGLYAFALLGLAGAVYAAGWLVQLCLTALLFVAERLFGAISRTLNYKKLRLVLVILAVAAIAVPQFLPSKLPCPSGDAHTSLP